MRIGKYELKFGHRRIFANNYETINIDGVDYNPNVSIPIRNIYKCPLRVIRSIANVFCGKHPF